MNLQEKIQGKGEEKSARNEQNDKVWRRRVRMIKMTEMGMMTKNDEDDENDKIDKIDSREKPSMEIGMVDS